MFSLAGWGRDSLKSFFLLMIMKSWPLPLIPLIPLRHTCLHASSLCTWPSVSDNQLDGSVCAALFLHYFLSVLILHFSLIYPPPSLALLGVVRKGCSSGHYSPETGPPASGPDIRHRRATVRQSLQQREQDDPRSEMQIEERVEWSLSWGVRQ